MFPSNSFLLQAARDAWKTHSALRANRRRLMHHTYGDQWGDLTLTPDGRTVTEYEQAMTSGMRPLTNNLLRSLVKSIVGRFRYNISQAEASLSDDGLSRIYDANLMTELDSRALEEFLISGTVIQRVVYENRPPAGSGVWIDNVSFDSFFCTPFRDPRATDMRLIGMLHDMTLDELKLRFGHDSKRRHRHLEKLYRNLAAQGPFVSITDFGREESMMDFFTPPAGGFCRVIEVWTYDIDPHHPSRDPHWHCRFLAPDGSVIDHTRTPLRSGGHPFILKFYPLTDGEVHPFIEDLVGQQKHINTLITTIDHILANSAKGVLLMPTDAIPAGLDMEMVADIWSRPGGVIPINPTARERPVEITASGRSEGAAKLLEIEMQLFQQISGVTSALQGQAPASNVSASLYESQVYNSAIALLDLYESFNSFRTMRDRVALAALPDS
ncbi:MAG: hypothetical protein HDS06_03365 [Bacteroides sp.]|nr:hypothetical protein [Bacteroides sp.]